MRTREFKWLMVGLFVLWFAVVVPGHQRGAIALPGERAARGDEFGAGGGIFGDGLFSGSGCPLCVVDENGKTEGEEEPYKAPTERCAICYITGVLDVPLVIDLTPPPLWEVDYLPLEDRESVIYISAVFSPISGRAPPLATSEI
ncbi:hypothetical protein [Poriferisphaera corsica]|uniref:hypothetical protein n=1 Tax=Poriferisphaera corsica TaxID=2528020 RepID=UPI00119D60F9|nr:hypothetical protein [Poriferisphaera corsica]